ncbi:hypothetical protein [Bacillus sp. AFS017336]|uniref:hypothetical protein n=1 Tax=Bacillus sp. AFS017336 TaxID=2033489 RepID=UPI001155E18D|nr:hypothetical protein [Bacillus sp. AFS017336]
MKRINSLISMWILFFMLAMSSPVDASRTYNSQTIKVNTNSFVLTKQTSTNLALRRSYRSNRSYRPTAPRSSYRSYRSPGRNFFGYAGAFGLGSLFGSMLNPFGGYYGGQHFGFSFFSLLLDILVIVVIIWFIKRIFRRNQY